MSGQMGRGQSTLCGPSNILRHCNARPARFERLSSQHAFRATHLKFSGAKTGKFKLQCLPRAHCYSRSLEAPQVGSFRQEPVNCPDRLSGEKAKEKGHRLPSRPPGAACQPPTSWRGHLAVLSEPGPG